jgi:putative FmdB family regulatory protein
MPTYDYVCDACDHSFELVQSMKDNALKKCPKCGKQKLRRLFGTGAAIVFKGSGFYQTDYRSESYKKAAAADKTAASGEGKSTSENKSGSESKSTSESKSSGESKSTSESKPSEKSSESKPKKEKGAARKD